MENCNVNLEGIEVEYLNPRKDRKQNNSFYTDANKQFRNLLLNKGCTVTPYGKKYVSVVKDKDNCFLYFTTHNAYNTNYLVSVTPSSHTKKFAFFDVVKNKPYYVPASKVVEFIKSQKKYCTFNGTELYVRIPDAWVQANKEKN